MDINLFSKDYKIKKLSEENVDEIYNLCCKNVIYYEHCKPFVSKESIIFDLSDTPPNVDLKDKYYLGYYEGEKLIVLLDLIDNYPDEKMVYIGFFMTDTSVQNKGVGSKLISELVEFLKLNGYERIRLAWIKGNNQSESFWIKNNFKVIKETKGNVSEVVLLAERIF